jgi:DNA mismatch endonuclease (patch repair protein)
MEFWSAKFDRNVARDRVVRSELTKLGWRVQVIWECDTRDSTRLERRLRRILARAGKSNR